VRLTVFVLGLVVGAAACASAGKFGDTGSGNDAAPPSPPIDAARTPVDAPRAIDAPRPIDAHLVDAEPDARPIDARPIDAEPIDAEPIDAPRPIDAGCTPTTTQLLANASFDASPLGSGWTQKPIQNAPGGPYPLIVANSADVETPNTLPDEAYLGGIDGDEVDPQQTTVSDELYQDVTVPAGTTQLVLSGFYFVVSDESPSDPTVYDTGAVSLVTTTGSLIETALSVSNVTAASMTGYVAFSHTFTTDVAGQAVHVKLASTNDSIKPTAFYFDTLSLEATHCP
jgi:hypothetical protein